MEKQIQIQISLLYLLLISVNLINCQSDDDNATDATLGIVANITNITDVFRLPEEVYLKYSEYQILEDYNKTCAYEHIFDSFNEKKLEEMIRKDNCIPNIKTLQSILEAGWLNLAEYLVSEVYLPKQIDPTNAIYSYLKKYESQAGKLKYLLNDSSLKYDNLLAAFSYENFQNSIKITIPLPDASFVVEYLSVYCYKDMFKIRGIFKAKHKIFKMNESKKLYDMTEAECEYNYNSFNHKIEITFDKLNKIKVWNTLFK